MDDRQLERHPISDASARIDARITAMGATGRGCLTDDTSPMWIGMPATSQEAQDFCQHVATHMLTTLARGEADLPATLAGALEHVLATGITVGMEAERDG
jgi:hypothetical protein